MEITNRTTKLLSQYIAGKDPERIALQGILIDGPNMIACNGFILAIVGGTEGSDHFAEPGVYRIDEKQAINAPFTAQEHEYITEGKYPIADAALPNDNDYVHHEIQLQVSVLEDLLSLLKGVDSQYIRLKMPESPTKPIVWEGSLPCRNGVHIDHIRGIIMPTRVGEGDELASGNVLAGETIDTVREMVSNANTTIEKLIKEPA